jgi:hypothetical protein
LLPLEVPLEQAVGTEDEVEKEEEEVDEPDAYFDDESVD